MLSTIGQKSTKLLYLLLLLPVLFLWNTGMVYGQSDDRIDTCLNWELLNESEIEHLEAVADQLILCVLENDRILELIQVEFGRELDQSERALFNVVMEIVRQQIMLAFCFLYESDPNSQLMGNQTVIEISDLAADDIALDTTAQDLSQTDGIIDEFESELLIATEIVGDLIGVAQPVLVDEIDAITVEALEDSISAIEDEVVECAEPPDHEQVWWELRINFVHVLPVELSDEATSIYVVLDHDTFIEIIYSSLVKLDHSSATLVAINNCDTVILSDFPILSETILDDYNRQHPELPLVNYVYSIGYMVSLNSTIDDQGQIDHEIKIYPVLLQGVYNSLLEYSNTPFNKQYFIHRLATEIESGILSFEP